MSTTGRMAFLRKYWQLFLLAAAAVAAIAFALVHFDVDPETLLRTYGYYVILVWTFLEGETIVIIAGTFSAKLGLNLWLIALCAFCGSFASDQVMFSLGKYKGKAVLGRFPKIGRNIDKAAGLFKKYDVALILGFRFIYGVRNVTPIMLGISGVSHRKFFFLNLIGAAVWAFSFSFGGYYAGRAFMHAMDTIGHGIFYVLLAVLAAAGLIWLVRSRRSVKHAAQVSRLADAALAGDSRKPADTGPTADDKDRERSS